MAVKKGRKKHTPLIDDYHLLTYDMLDSTNAEAKRLAGGGGAHGAFIWAQQQSAGRGRQNREWISESGNLFASILLSPECELKEMPQLSYIAAVAAYASVSPLLPEEELRFKWPNDLLLNGKKLAGILLESFETKDEELAQHQQWLVIGLGMNIESAPLDEEVSLPATSLKEVGVELISAKIVLSRFIHHFIEWYQLWQEDGFEMVQKYWMTRCAHQGETIKIAQGETVLEGAYEGLDETGNLLLKQASGEVVIVNAGEVIL